MMPIKRSQRTQKFTTIPNEGLRDSSLSFKARGLLAYMLTLPDDWVFYERELISHTTEGRDAIKSALKELEQQRYLVRKRSRSLNGRLGEPDWIIYDTPQPRTDKPTLDKPTLENPSLVESPVNQDSSNKNADIKAFSPRTENPPLVETPVLKQSDNKNVDIEAFPPRTGFPTLEKPTLENPQLLNTNYTKDLLNQRLNNKTLTTTKDLGKASSSSGLKPIQDFWENNGFGSMSSFLFESFTQWLADFKELGASADDATALILKALEISVTNGVRKYNYVNSIMNNWANDRITSVAMVDAKDKQRASSKQSTNSSADTGVYLEHNKDGRDPLANSYIDPETLAAADDLDF